MNGNTPESGFRARIEDATKTGAFVVVVLYAVGLFITNAHLLELGVSDFSAFQARFVMVGLLFFYFLFLTIVSPVSLILGGLFLVSLDPPKQRRWYRPSVIIAVVITLIAVFLAILPAAGVLLGYVSVPGRAFVDTPRFNLNPLGQLADPFVRDQLRRSFGHYRIIQGGLTIGVAVSLALAPYVVKGFSWGNTAWIRRLAIIWLGLSLPLFVFGYADDVFPNLRYNLGGGQPRIASLHLKPSDSLSLRVPLLRTASSSLLEATTPVALWHQDGGFLYVGPISKGRKIHLTGVALSSVQAISELPGFILVRKGTIDSVFVQDADSSAATQGPALKPSDPTVSPVGSAPSKKRGGPTAARVGPSSSREQAKAPAGISSSGQLYRLVAVGPVGQAQTSIPHRIQFCGSIRSGWFAMRGSWWVAVDSSAPCDTPSNGTTLPAYLKRASGIHVDSGLLQGSGRASFDTLYLESFLRAGVLPSLHTAIGVTLRDTLFVRGISGDRQKVYVEVRR